MCNCIKETNEAMEKSEMNTKLRLAFSLNGTINRAIISVEKFDDKIKKKPIKLFATYCPFCGQKYEDL
jgi:hypothetical protein